MHVWTTILLFPFFVCLGLAQRAEEERESTAADEKLLQVFNVPSDGPGLLKYLHERTLTKEQQEKLAGTIQQLGDASYPVRVRAAAELVKAGELARPLLLDVLKDSPEILEIRRRAELCLRQITDNPETTQTAAVVRLLAQRKPEGAAESLIHFLPFVTDSEVLEAGQNTLNVLAMDEGKPDPAVVEALQDRRAGLRTMAAVALVRAGGLAQKPLVEPLLRDPQPQVRLSLALALVDKHDREAVPEIIKLLGVLPSDQAWQAEELLHRLAGDKGPGVLTGSGLNPAKMQAAWKSWWDKNQASIDLTLLDEVPRLQGFTLVTQLGKGVAGKVVELGPAKDVRWQIEGLQYPVDAHIIGPNRVLIAEYLGRRVTERDFQGKIYWERSVDLPIACKRLPGGKTFIATRRQILILDAQGKELFTYHHQNTSMAAASCGPDGQLYLVSSGGLFQRLNAQGREVKSFQIGPMYTLGANLEVLPAGRILVPQYRDNKVVEYDSNGKVVWEAKVPLPTSAVRLANGHTLVTTSQMRVLELNRQGNTIWEYQPDSRPLRARRR